MIYDVCSSTVFDALYVQQIVFNVKGNENFTIQEKKTILNVWFKQGAMKGTVCHKTIQVIV